MAKAKSAASPLMKRHRIAAALLAEGLNVQEVALRAGCDVDTLLHWMHDPAVMALYREKVMGSEVVSYARAVKRIMGQMDDENPMVALRAAKEALEKFGDAMSGDDGTVHVRVEGMPALGMPAQAAEENRQ